jgi:tRNA(fMet)-specific endonuclease VapC
VSGTDPAGLLDTSVVIALGTLTAADLPEESFISAVTLAELSVGPMVATTDDERLARQSVLQVTEAHFSPLAFDAESARAFGRVAAALRGTGRKRRARTYDALIAAAGLRHELPIYTCNPEDFTGIPGLIVRTVGPSLLDSP